MSEPSLSQIWDELKNLNEDVKSLIKVVAEHEVRLDDIRPYTRSCPKCGSRLMRNDDRCHVCS